MISLDPDWDSLEPIEGDYHFGVEYIDNDLNTIYPYGKTVLLRINSMGGCSPTGKTPPWVFTAMGQPDSPPPLRRVLLTVFSMRRIRSGDLSQSFGILPTWQKRKRSLQWLVRT